MSRGPGRLMCRVREILRDVHPAGLLLFEIRGALCGWIPSARRGRKKPADHDDRALRRALVKLEERSEIRISVGLLTGRKRYYSNA